MDENVTAFVLCLGFAVALALSFEAKGAAKGIFALAVIPMLAAIFHLGSRSGVVAVLLTVVIVYIAALRVSVEKIFVRIVALALLFAAGVVFARYLLASSFVPTRVVDLFSDRAAVGDSDRSKIVAAFLHHQDQWKVTGVGYGADADFLALTNGAYMNVHNQFWSSWVELGLAGLAVLATVSYFWIRALCRRGAPTWALAMLAPVAVFAVTLGVDKTDSVWFCIGAVAALGADHGRRVATDGSRLAKEGDG